MWINRFIELKTKTLVRCRVSLRASTMCPCSAMAFSAPRNAVLSPSVVMWLMIMGSRSLRNSRQISSTVWSSLPIGFWQSRVAAHSLRCSAQISPLFLLLHSLFLGYVFRDGVGRLCCWLEGVPIPGPVQGIVVPVVTLHRYWCIPGITATLHNVLQVSSHSSQIILNHLDYHGPHFVGIVL